MSMKEPRRGAEPEMLRDFFAGLGGYRNLSIMLSVKCDHAHSAVSVS